MNKKSTKIGYYTVVKRIGHGAFAKVDLATHDLLDIKVAIKIISRKKASFEDNFNKFLTEIEIYKELKHRHVVKLFEVFKSEHSLYLIMEYAPKGDLYTILNTKTKFSEAEARHYFRQMISALVYCHAKGYAHRDLKLENLFLDDLNDIKIGDFGLAGILKPSTLMKTSCGSLRYAAPEILRGKLYSGELADVWSVGVILFTFLSGYHPFDDDVYVSMLQKIKRNNYTIPTDISVEAVDLIKKMLQSDCTRRITMTEILCHPWLTYTSFPKYIDYKLFKIVNLSTKVHRIPPDPELVTELAAKEWDWNMVGKGDLLSMVINNENNVFVVGYHLIQFERIKSQRQKVLAAHSHKPNVFRLPCIERIFESAEKGERFHRTFRAYTIDLFNDYIGRPWRIGLNFYSNLRRVIRTFIKAASAENVKIEIVLASEFRFRGSILDVNKERTDESFLMQVFQNSSDEYVLDLVNENMANLKFVMLCFKLFKRMKV